MPCPQTLPRSRPGFLSLPKPVSRCLILQFPDCHEGLHTRRPAQDILLVAGNRPVVGLVQQDTSGRERTLPAGEVGENEAAIARGVFGAPFFFVDGEPFWGNDRRPQIERWLEKGPF